MFLTEGLQTKSERLNCTFYDYKLRVHGDVLNACVIMS